MTSDQSNDPSTVGLSGTGPDPGRSAMAIGMFSRASLLSVKALRAYHQAGLLVPAIVDPRTGYRSYTPDQLADAAIIVRLRELDLPLARVREVLERRDPEVTAKVLAEHRVEMEERLAQTERIVAELGAEPAAVTHTPIHVRSEAPTHTLSITAPVTVADAAGVFGRAYGRLYELVAATGAVPTGPAGALYRNVVSEEPEPVEAFVPIAEPVVLPADEREVVVSELPAVEVAVIVHPGPFEDCAPAYRTLGAWVARHATHVDEPVRELYLVGPDQVSDPAHHRTEIAWPIRPGSTH